MLTNSKLKRQYFACAILIVALLATALAVFLSGRIRPAQAETVPEETNYAEYLDSDTLLHGGYKIQDYPNLIATRNKIVQISDGGLKKHFEFQNLDQDDPIVEIVPKNLFFEVGDHLFMGNEYGFFIKTKNFKTDYQSTVMVFDIITNTNLVETIDRVITTVTPIFQYEYIGLTGKSNEVKIKSSTLNYQLNKPCVVAHPSEMSLTFGDGGVIEYDMTEQFYLKDISFGASLYNEQTLNRGDTGYDPYNDYGSYFTGFDYTYKGKNRVYGDFPGEDLGWNIADTVLFVLGCFDAIPGVGTVTAPIGSVYDLASLIYNWIEFKKDVAHSNIGTVENVGKTITATCYYQNRDDQLRYIRTITTSLIWLKQQRLESIRTVNTVFGTDSMMMSPGTLTSAILLWTDEFRNTPDLPIKLY